MEPEIGKSEAPKKAAPPLGPDVKLDDLPELGELTREPSEELERVCTDHGHETGTSRREWSKRTLSQGLTETGLPPQQTEWPKNKPLLDALVEKYAHLGFRYELVHVPLGKGRERRHVRFYNYPEVDGRSPTLTELFFLPASMIDAKRTPKKRKRKPRKRRDFSWRH